MGKILKTIVLVGSIALSSLFTDSSGQGEVDFQEEILCTVSKGLDIEFKKKEEETHQKTLQLSSTANKILANEETIRKLLWKKPDTVINVLNHRMIQTIKSLSTTERVGFSALPDLYSFYENNPDFLSLRRDLLNDTVYLDKMYSLIQKSFSTIETFFKNQQIENANYNPGIEAMIARSKVQDIPKTGFANNIVNNENGSLSFSDKGSEVKELGEVLNFSSFDDESFQKVLDALAPGLTLEIFEKFSPELKKIFHYALVTIGRTETGYKKEHSHNTFGSDYHRSNTVAGQFLNALNHFIKYHRQFFEFTGKVELESFLKEQGASADYFFALLILNFPAYNSGPAFINVNEVLTTAILVEHLKKMGYKNLNNITLSQIAVFSVLRHAQSFDQKTKSAAYELIKKIAALNPSIEENSKWDKFYYVQNSFTKNPYYKGKIVANYLFNLLFCGDLYSDLDHAIFEINQYGRILTKKLLYLEYFLAHFYQNDLVDIDGNQKNTKKNKKINKKKVQVSVNQQKILKQSPKTPKNKNKQNYSKVAFSKKNP